MQGRKRASRYIVLLRTKCAVARTSPPPPPSPLALDLLFLSSFPYPRLLALRSFPPADPACFVSNLTMENAP